MTLTKALIPAAIAATLGTAAIAENAFSYQQMPLEGPVSALTINGLNADSAGVIAVYDYSGADYGELLGTAQVNAGANADVVINLDMPALQDVVAVFYEGALGSPSMGSAMLEIEVDS